MVIIAQPIAQPLREPAPASRPFIAPWSFPANPFLLPVLHKFSGIIYTVFTPCPTYSPPPASLKFVRRASTLSQASRAPLAPKVNRLSSTSTYLLLMRLIQTPSIPLAHSLRMRTEPLRQIPSLGGMSSNSSNSKPLHHIPSIYTTNCRFLIPLPQPLRVRIDSH